MNIATYTSGSGQDLVILHGWTHDHRSMRPLIDLLSPHFKVTAADLPGAGGSDWDFNFASVNDSADAMLDSLPDNAIYVAWSWGGAVAQSIAGRYPERVKHLVLIGSVPKFIAEDNWPGVPKPGFKAVFNDFKSEEKFKKFVIEYYDIEFENGKVQPQAYAELVNNLDQYGAAVPLDVEVQGINIIDDADLRQEFSRIQCPIDMINGTKDDSVPVNWDKVKALNPTNVHLHFIENAMHMSFWTHPEEFNSILKSALKI